MEFTGIWDHISKNIIKMTNEDFVKTFKSRTMQLALDIMAFYSGLKKYDKTISQVSMMPSAINQVWTNIIDNAIDAMKEAKERKLEIETKQNGAFVLVYIRDTGSGIPEDIQDKIFDPFFTTKKIGEGTGLGLEIAHNIIAKDHKGAIKVKSQVGDTEFEICFPIVQK